MLSPIDQYFSDKEEPVKSCLQFLRNYIISLDKENITESLSYGMPFYYYKGKRFCYLWTHKKLGQPYLGIVEGHLIKDPALVSENRAKMKILLLDPRQDLPVKKINSILRKVIAF